MEEGLKEVDFHTYCAKCKFKDLKEDETPCDECLSQPVNVYSHKPVKYEEKIKGDVKSEK